MCKVGLNMENEVLKGLIMGIEENHSDYKGNECPYFVEMPCKGEIV